MKILRHPLLMRPSPEAELEQAIDRELRALPDRVAPATLVPRVIQAIAQREQLPWWTKAFAYWPWPARGLFLAATTSLAALFLYFTWGLSTGVTFNSLIAEVGELAAFLDLAGTVLGALANAGLALVKTVGPGWMWIGAGVAGACYLTTLGLGTYCYRLASQRI